MLSCRLLRLHLRFACMCSSGLGALTCPFCTKFFRSIDLRFTTSPAIATYTLLAVRASNFVLVIGLMFNKFVAVETFIRLDSYKIRSIRVVGNVKLAFGSFFY